jgi:AcrR family transcriptional regulator
MMDNKKINRRVKYTRMVLKDSFIKLMKAKPIRRITITEICEEADINRATFYSHYTDQYDLLRQIEQELVDDINEYLESYRFNEDESQFLQMMEKIFEYIKENAEVFTVLLSENGDRNFQKDVMMIVWNRCKDEWAAKKSVREEIAQYMYTYVASGCIGIILKWLQSGMDKSIHDMAVLVSKMTNQGLSVLV